MIEMNKSVLTSFTILYLLSTVFLMGLGFNIRTVKANGTIYIRADGSVEGTDKILRNGDVYTFTDNLVEKEIVIEKNDVVIDGANFSLQGSGFENESRGIYVPFRNNVTIQNVKVTGYRDCIFLENTTDSKVIQNDISSDLWENGINIANSTNILVSNNKIIHFAD
ncbi:right-handed parallel beta-helix repeat-containing protein, partial [Candidatus Bathyarchaeota archaeon]|nr:right-handed parallel beta-helix repeat-containing protein [Candidatus Bathyarchaeota archaeon]